MQHTMHQHLPLHHRHDLTQPYQKRNRQGFTENLKNFGAKQGLHFANPVHGNHPSQSQTRFPPLGPSVQTPHSPWLLGLRMLHSAAHGSALTTDRRCCGARKAFCMICSWHPTYDSRPVLRPEYHEAAGNREKVNEF